MNSFSEIVKLPSAPRVHRGCELRGYEALERESDYWIEAGDMRGALPAGLEGTLFLTCVGRAPETLPAVRAAFACATLCCTDGHK